MAFYPDPAAIPDGLTRDQLVFEPLGPEHVERDYEALMDSKEHLRMWSGTSWPADDFTLADNMEDMEMHAREQRERIAFAYTIMTPDRERTVGCLYIISGEAVPADIPDDTAVVDFWVRASELENDLDEVVLEALLGWLDEEWEFADVRHAARLENTRHLDLLGRVLEPAERLESEVRGTYQLFRSAG